MNSAHFSFGLFLEREVSQLFSLPIRNTMSNTELPLRISTNSSSALPHLLKDFPDYLEATFNSDNSYLKYSVIDQYSGFLVNLSDFDNVPSYITYQLSKRNQKNLKAKKKKLENKHSIRSQYFFGAISPHQFNNLFLDFYHLLFKRFEQKKVFNRYLKDWPTLAKFVYNKILRKEAGLFVLFSNDRPIAFTLNFHLGDIVFSHIQSYDIRYTSYNLGDICMLHNLEWCIENRISVFDLSMIETEYKRKWCNTEYRFAHYFFYKKGSFLQYTRVRLHLVKYKILQFMRDKRIIGGIIQLDKWYYRIKRIPKLTDTKFVE